MTAKRVEATPTFLRAFKKLHARDQSTVEQAVAQIAADPTLGDMKKGDLAGVRVFKFKLNKQERLLSYREDADAIILLALGSHENFYRDMKR